MDRRNTCFVFKFNTRTTAGICDAYKQNTTWYNSCDDLSNKYDYFNLTLYFNLNDTQTIFI